MRRPRSLTGVLPGAAWGKDFASAYTYFDPLFDSSGRERLQLRVLGTTEAEQLKEYGYDVPEVPSIDDKIDECWGWPSRRQTSAGPTSTSR